MCVFFHSEGMIKIIYQFIIVFFFYLIKRHFQFPDFFEDAIVRISLASHDSYFTLAWVELALSETGFGLGWTAYKISGLAKNY